MLRKGLGGEWLVADRETIGTHPQADLWLDVAHFRRLLSSPRTHGHPEAETYPECLEALAEAVELYRGDFLEGLSLRGSANFDEWQFFQTDGLRQELALALERLVHGYSAQGAYEQAIPYGQRWVALDPLHESAQRELMQLYALAGQRAAALRQYKECARILEAEIGLPPSEAMTALYEQIRTSQAIGEEPVRPVARPRHNLPAQTTPFVGREEELKAIRARLHEPACRLLTLVGPGGVGKTRLALEAASGLVPQMEQVGFADGVYLVRMAPLESAEAFVPAVAKALGFSFYGEAEGSKGPDPQPQLLDHLRQKRLLLLLDNFEQLLVGVQLVNAILAAAPGVEVLATSRARLGLQGEHLYTVTGMQFPELVFPSGIEIPEEALAYSAVKLFMQTAQRVCPGFEPQPEEFGHRLHLPPIGDTRGIARSLLRLSSIAQFQGQPSESARLAREGIAISRGIGDQGGVASGISDLAVALLRLGEFAQAESTLEESPAIHHNLGFYSASSSIQQVLARAHLGRYGEARAQADAALALSREIGHRPHIGQACWLLGCVLLAEGAHSEAQVLCRESAQHLRRMERGEEPSWALAGLACAERAVDHHAQARQFFHEALKICTEIGSRGASLLPAIALLLADQGEVGWAVELYALASRYPYLGRSRWYQDLFELSITKAAAALPPGSVKAAEERGRSRDVMATLSELLTELGE